MKKKRFFISFTCQTRKQQEHKLACEQTLIVMMNELVQVAIGADADSAKREAVSTQLTHTLS